jgi:hypothetical protein
MALRRSHKNQIGNNESINMSLVNTSGASGVALSGYDAVSFFNAGSKPLNGDPGNTAVHKGATYFFASNTNKKMFESNPDKYAPQFGGFCAFGVSVGNLFPVDVTTAQLYNDKLYLNLNPVVLTGFEKDKDANIAKAEKEWPDLEKTHGK